MIFGPAVVQWRGRRRTKVTDDRDERRGVGGRWKGVEGGCAVKHKGVRTGALKSLIHCILPHGLSRTNILTEKLQLVFCTTTIFRYFLFIIYLSLHLLLTHFFYQFKFEALTKQNFRMLSDFHQLQTILFNIKMCFSFFQAKKTYVKLVISCSSVKVGSSVISFVIHI